ncbi:MAG: deoxyribose-phosphate aldolase [Geminicoccaceae bacterium]|nr:deoxyribose-phosphate aldolase [Geminicoccaceae bacterium]
MIKTPPDLLGQASHAPGNASAAARILPLVDLTSLNDGDDERAIRKLCARARDAGVAAVCAFPRFVPVMKEELRGSGIAVATVANFPAGGDDVPAVVREIEGAVADGAEEIDVVIPLAAAMEGDVGLVTELVTACREATPNQALKVILETGRLEEPARITAAARAAIMARPDFLKTSTGKSPTGATLEAAAILLAVIEEADGAVGLKLSGGIRTTQQAAQYLYLIDHFMSPGWVRPGTVRFGASSLLDDLERILGGAGAPDDDGDGGGDE